MNEDKHLQDTFADWRWRLNNLYYIQSKDGSKILFNENPLQKLINDDPYPFKRILKSRQIGFTTDYLIRMLDFALWNKNKNAFCMADKNDRIEKLFRIVSRAYKWMDEDLKPELDRGMGSKYEYYFPGIESRIGVGLESRGDTIHWLHISEASFSDPDRIKATLEAVPKDGIITFETTANGMGNHFYDDWVKPGGRFKNYFFPWFMHDEYFLNTPKIKPTPDEKTFIKNALKNYKVKISQSQLAWRRMKIEDQKDLYLQEYPEDDINCFLSSGSPAIDLKRVMQCMESTRPIISDKDGVKLYVKPDKTKMYAIGADPAEGIGGDNSSATVFEIESREQVATLHGQFPPRDFAERLESLAGLFASPHRPQPLLGVERNNHGHAVLLWLKDSLNYPNLYRAKDKKLGFLTDRVTRPLMVDTLIEGIENDSITLNANITLQECLTLINNNGKIEAAENKQDDSFIATAIGLQMVLKNNLKIYDNISKRIRI